MLCFDVNRRRMEKTRNSQSMTRAILQIKLAFYPKKNISFNQRTSSSRPEGEKLMFEHEVIALMIKRLISYSYLTNTQRQINDIEKHPSYLTVNITHIHLSVLVIVYLQDCTTSKLRRE